MTKTEYDIELKIIILSYTKDTEFLQMLKNCVASIHKSCKNLKYEIIVVETGNLLYELNVDYIIKPNEKFNYNRFLNIALEQTDSSEFVLISNNDTLYTKNSIKTMLSALKSKYDSVSPWEPSFHPNIHRHNHDFYEGHIIRKHITGWSILVRMDALKKIGKFDEQFDFWGQDDDYGLNLKKNNLKHALVRKSIVYHLSHDNKRGKSHGLIEKKDYIGMTSGGSKKVRRKWNH